MNAAEANIANLTALWTRMGRVRRDSAPDATHGLHLNISEAWPHRRWLDWGVQPEQSQAQAVCELLEDDPVAVVPVWPADSSDSSSVLSRALARAGWRSDFELMAMRRPGVADATVASASEPAKTPKDGLVFEQVASHALADEWTRVASESFGYVVDPPVVRGLLDEPGVQMLLAVRDGHFVGTALMFEDRGVLGVHMVGVPPAFRRQGLARRVMQAVMQRADAMQLEHVVLQAAALAEPLYLSLGFERQFPIPHYRKDKQP